MRTTGLKTSKRNEELDSLLSEIDPEDFLVWLGVDYQTTRGRSGVQLNIRECPRCGGRDNKVYLNAETGLGTCFHGACIDEPGFNLFSFTKAFCDDDGRAAIDQLKDYAKTVGWKPKSGTARHLSTDVKATSGITLPKSHELPIQGKNLTYLQARGIDTKVVEQLGLRYCKNGYFAYQDAEGNERHQDYSGRVIIPVFDLEGVVRTFQGRDITGKSDRKYLFPPGVAGTGQFLYNAHNAIGCETLVISEGAFDVAATLMAIRDDHTENLGVVGSFGKSISMSDTGENDQLTQLYRFKEAGMNRTVFLWDGEFVTLDDACKEALKLRRYGFDTFVAQLPEDKDPNEVPAPVVRKAIREAFRATTMKVNDFRLRLRAARA